ncbi:TniQ family protein [Deinococcus wulumuqiensis]
MSATMRRLTSVPECLEGKGGSESFASFIERLAAHQLVPAPVTTLLAATGLIAEDRYDALPAGYGIDLTPQQRRDFATVCDLSLDEVDSMLMRQFDGVAFDLTGLDVADASSVRTVAHREWAGFAGSACCPACLQENGGAWLLRWKLWTSFVCMEHCVLLVDRCPRCERRTGSYRADQGNRPRFATHVPMPGRCANSLAVGAAGTGKAARPCGQDLTCLPAVDLSDAARLLQAQQDVNAVIKRGTGQVAGEQVPALVYFRHLRSLVALALHGARVEDLGELPGPVRNALEDYILRRDDIRYGEAGRKGTSLHPYKAPPGDVRVIAATLPWAVEVLRQPDQLALTEALRPMIERSREVRGSQIRRVGVDFHFDGALEMALSRILAFRAPLRHTVGHLAPAGTGAYRTFRPEHVPHLIWRDDYERDFRPLLAGSGVGETAVRVAISVALVMLTGQHSRKSAVPLLGLEGLHKGTSLPVVMMHLNSTQQVEAFQTALHALADRLEGPGPHRDYRVAQRQLVAFRVVDTATWLNLGEAAGVQVSDREAQRRNAAAWVWAEVLSSDPALSPAMRGSTPQERESLLKCYRDFLHLHQAALEPALLEVVADIKVHLETQHRRFHALPGEGALLDR